MVQKDDRSLEETMQSVRESSAQTEANLKQLKEDDFQEKKEYIIEMSDNGQYTPATLRYRMLMLDLLHEQRVLQRENNDLLRTVVRQQEELISLQRTRTCNCKNK